jgi:hypothetical protein
MMAITTNNSISVNAALGLCFIGGVYLFQKLAEELGREGGAGRGGDFDEQRAEILESVHVLRDVVLDVDRNLLRLAGSV